MTRSPFTPDAGGYVVAVLISFAAMVVLLALGVLDEGLGQVAAALLLGVLYVTVAGTPCALVGVPLVHLACRRVPFQAVHVVVAGLVGLLAGLVFDVLVLAPLDGGPASVPMALEVGVSAAIGRLAVVRMVPAVRARRWVPLPPVDDDFAGTPPGW